MSEGFRIPKDARIEVEPHRRDEIPDYLKDVRPTDREVVCNYCKMPSPLGKVITFPLPHSEKLARINPDRFAGKVLWKCPRCKHTGGVVDNQEQLLWRNGIDL